MTPDSASRALGFFCMAFLGAWVIGWKAAHWREDRFERKEKTMPLPINDDAHEDITDDQFDDMVLESTPVTPKKLPAVMRSAAMQCAAKHWSDERTWDQCTAHVYIDLDRAPESAAEARWQRLLGPDRAYRYYCPRHPQQETT